jgi:bifunctional enzyme CysN/CysC
VTLTFVDDLDIIRGDVLADPTDRPTLSRWFAADLVWMVETPALSGGHFLLKTGTATVPATISRVVDTLDIDSLQRTPGEKLELNTIGRA